MTVPARRRAGGTILGRSHDNSGRDEALLAATEEGQAVEASFEDLADEPIDGELAVDAGAPTNPPAHWAVGAPASVSASVSVSKPRPRPGSLAGRWPLVGCVALGLTSLVFATLALQQRNAVKAQRDQTNELTDVSGRTIAALTSYDYQHLDQWKSSVLANATGSFQNQFESGFTGFEQTYIAEHNRGTGAVQGVWVGSVASGKATTVVLVQITVTSLTGTHSLEPYVEVTLLKVAGRWRVDDVQATFDTSGNGAATPPPGGQTATSSP